MSVCLSVCLFAMRFHTVQPISMKLSRNHPLIQGKVDVGLEPPSGVRVGVLGEISPRPCNRGCFRFSDTYPYQTFHMTCLGPMKGRH